MTLAAPPVAAQQTAVQARVIVALVVVASALANLEVGLVNVALPTLADTFAVPLTTIQWVVLAYQLAIVGTLVLFGRLVDLLGGRRLYLAGMGTIAVGSVAAAASVNALWLILARGLLGLGAAMLLATGQALLAAAYPRAGRSRVLGVMHMAVAGGLMTGPALGGLLVTTLGWRAVLLAPLPLALAALGWAWKVLPGSGSDERAPLDRAGAFLVVTTILALVLGMTRLAKDGWDAYVLGFLITSMLLGAFLVVVERRQLAPLVDLRLLSDWRLSAGLIVAFLTFVALASNMFLVPFALQELMGYSAAGAGLIMMAVPLAILPTAPLAGALADRIGTRLPATVGLVTIVGAILAMAQFRSGTALWFALATLGMYGVGAGLFQAPNNSAVLGSAPRARIGTISGMLALARNLGQITGVAVASAVWTWRQSTYDRSSTPPLDDPLAAGVRDAFLVLAGFGAVALAIALLRPDRKDARR